MNVILTMLILAHQYWQDVASVSGSDFHLIMLNTLNFGEILLTANSQGAIIKMIIRRNY